MSLGKFIAAFEATVEDVERGSLHAGTEFKSIQSWDSLAVLTVTDMVEMEFRVLLRKDDYTASANLGELYATICSKAAG